MQRHLQRSMAMVFGLSLLGVECAAQTEPATPAEQYQALLKEFERASSSGRALTDLERRQFVGHVFKLRNKLALKFVELAEKHPTDPIALDALIQAVWQVNTTPWPIELVGKDDAWLRAFSILRRDHIRSDKLGPVCQRISGGVCPEYEPFLRAVLDQNPHRNVQAQACMALAHFLTNRSHRIDMVNEQPELAKEFADLFGKEYLAELQRQDRTKASKEAETLFERAAQNYAAVKLADGDTVGDVARSELFELRHLVIGKEVPEIEGQDQDGTNFKLSDYRGTVVLLDFWGEY